MNDIQELEVVRVIRTQESGVVVHSYQGGLAFEVEFPDGAVLTLLPGQLEKISND